MNPALCEHVKGREMTSLWLKSPSVGVTFSTEFTKGAKYSFKFIPKMRVCVRALR